MSDQIDQDGAESSASNFEIYGDKKQELVVRTFSTIENLPIANLKNEIYIMVQLNKQRKYDNRNDRVNVYMFELHTQDN